MSDIEDKAKSTGIHAGNRDLPPRDPKSSLTDTLDTPHAASSPGEEGGVRSRL